MHAPRVGGALSNSLHRPNCSCPVLLSLTMVMTSRYHEPDRTRAIFLHFCPHHQMRPVPSIRLPVQPPPSRPTTRLRVPALVPRPSAASAARWVSRRSRRFLPWALPLPLARLSSLAFRSCEWPRHALDLVQKHWHFYGWLLCSVHIL